MVTKKIKKMIKVKISRGMTSIDLESDENQLKEALQKAFEMFLEVERTTPRIPFSEEKVNSIVPNEPFTLTQEEIDMIEASKEKNDKAREKVKEEMADAVVDVVKVTNDQKKHELEEKERALAEKAKKEKEADDAENEARKERAKARRKRARLLENAREDDEVTSEMIAQEQSDAAEAEEDKLAQEIYDEKYAEKQNPKVETETKPKEEVKTEVKEEVKQEVKAETKAEKAETKTEAEPKVEAKNEPEPEKTTVESAISKVKLMLSNSNNKGTNQMDSIRRSINLLKEAGMSRIEALIECVVCGEDLIDTWTVLSRRPETIAAKFKFSKEEAEQAAKSISELIK